MCTSLMAIPIRCFWHTCWSMFLQFLVSYKQQAKCPSGNPVNISPSDLDFLLYKSVSSLVCHTHQTFSKRSVSVSVTPYLICHCIQWIVQLTNVFPKKSFSRQKLEIVLKSCEFWKLHDLGPLYCACHCKDWKSITTALCSSILNLWLRSIAHG